MTESEQDPAMRRNHMDRAIERLMRASDELEEARAWLWDLDHMPVLTEVASVKTQVDAAKIAIARIYEREFPDDDH